jgi:hypothetical protein
MLLAANATSATTAMALLRMTAPDNHKYPLVARSNTRLNQPKNCPTGPRAFRCGRSRSPPSAGLNVRALNAETMTEIAMVMANCWYSLPVMPGMKTVGTNTAASTRAIPITGPDNSSIAFRAASFGARPSSMCR